MAVRRARSPASKAAQPPRSEAEPSGVRAPASKAEREFVAEADEILERMREHASDLADRAAGKGEVPPELVNGLFRSAHSLKGLAGLFGFDPIRVLAHRLEDLLDGLRLGRVDLEIATVDRIERAVKLFAELLARLGDAEALAALADPVAALAEELANPRRASASTGTGEDPPAGAQGRRKPGAKPSGAERAGEVALAPTETDPFSRLDLERALLAALTEYEEHRLRESLRHGRYLHLAESTFEILSFEEGLAELTSGLRQVGEVLSTLPAPGECAASQIHFSVLVASDRSAAEIASALEMSGVSIRCVGGGPARRETEPASEETPGVCAPRADVVPPRGEVPASSGASLARASEGAAARGPSAEPRGSESLQSLGETVRVDIRKLDELMNLVGELVIQREALASFVARLASDPVTARSAGDLGRIHKDLDRRLRELQGAVIEVRLVPLRQVFDKVSRVVRRLRAELGKDVRLEVQGADTELDKLIVEALVDPLMHVVRNAVDHAIEGADERRAGGKPPQGLVRIDAFQRGNHVVIAVTDDGRGIDRAALRASAEAKGLVEPDESLGDRELLDLIFAAGVSTRAEVSDTSGRGVGMDVVRTNVTQLGGVVDVDSVPGRGTTISLTLPITLAIIQAIVVEADGQRFAVPLGAVKETLLVHAGQIQRSEGRELLDLRGSPLPLRRLAAEFGLRPAAPDAKLFAVVLGMGDARLGLLVDRLEGQLDAVIKPIHGPVGAVRGIAGAAELGGPAPVLVLDASTLLADAQGRREVA